TRTGSSSHASSTAGASYAPARTTSTCTTSPAWQTSQDPDHTPNGHSSWPSGAERQSLSAATATTPSTRARRAPSRSKSLESPVRRNSYAGFGGRPHGKGPATQAPRHAADPTYSFQLWSQALKTGADLLWRVQASVTLPVIEALPDGSYRSMVINPKITG